MAFASHLACNISDPDCPDREQWAFLGSLDEVDEDGNLLARAFDSIIFNDDEPAPAPAEPPPSIAPEPAAQSGEPAGGDRPQAGEGADEEDAFVPDPEFAAKALSLGIDAPSSAALEEMALAGLETLAFNRALFSVGDLDKAIGKAGAQGFVASSAWPDLREALVERMGLTNLTPEQGLGRNAMLAPQAFMDLEAEMIELAKRTTDKHPIPAELIAEVLATKPTMAEEQRVAAIASCSGEQAVVVTEGTAGAGKSFTLNAIREVYEKIPPPPEGGEPGYDIIGTALSWTATKVLEESAGLSGGRAIQGLTMAMEEAKASGGDFFKRRTILIVDEAGLVGVKHMHKILWHAANSKHPVRVLLTGDSLQLCPVEAGNALEAIVDECGSSRLDTIRRQKQASHRAAVKHFCYGRAEHGLWTYWQQEAIHFCANADERRELVMRDYVRYCVSNPQDVALVLALENAEVKRLNTEIRERLKLVGRLLGDEHEITVTDGRGAYAAQFCVGDQIVLRKNKVDHPVYKSSFQKIFHGAAAAQRRGESQASVGSFARWIAQWKKEKEQSADPAAGPAPEPEEIRQGIFNRTVGLIIDIKKNPDDPTALLVRVLLNEGGEVELDTSKYFDEKAGAVPFHHNFATTIYASQGQTVQKVLIMDSPYMNRRLAYVGMSRHTMMCDIYADCSEIEARVAKDGERQLERAWKRFEKDTKANHGPEQLRLAKLQAVVSEWAPRNGKSAMAKDYLKAMAQSWNQDSANPTVWIARKQMTRKKKADAPGGNQGFPSRGPGEDDDPDDHLSPRLPEPYRFEDLQMGAAAHPPKRQGFLAALSAKKKAEPEIVDEVLAPLVVTDSREPAALPEWAQEGPAKAAFDAGRGKFWDFNRYGYPRLLARDPTTGEPVSRWSLDGALKAGDGHVTVMPSDAGAQAPWMVVPGPREALLCWGHYRREGADPAKVPNLVCAPPAADLASLSAWLEPGSAPALCVWSPKNPDTFARAQELRDALRKLGHDASVHPPAPAAAQVPRRRSP